MKKLTENKAERMKELLKSFDEKGEVTRDSITVQADEESIKKETSRLKELARIDESTEKKEVNEWFSNSQTSGNMPFVAGYGQTVNTFLPNYQDNKQYNPNYTYLQPGEALELCIKRALESGAPVNNIDFYAEVNWNLNNMGFTSKSALDIKNSIQKMLKD